MAHEFYQTKDGYILDIECDKNKEAIASLELQRMLADARIRAAHFYVECINGYTSKFRKLEEKLQSLNSEVDTLDKQAKDQKGKNDRAIRECNERIQEKQKDLEEYIHKLESSKRMYTAEQKEVEAILKEKKNVLEELKNVKKELNQAEADYKDIVKNKLVPFEERLNTLKHFITEFEEREKARTRILFKAGPQMEVKVGTQFKPDYSISNKYLKVELESTDKRVVRECSPNVFKSYRVGYSNIIAIAEDGSKSCILVHVVK